MYDDCNTLFSFFAFAVFVEEHGTIYQQGIFSFWYGTWDCFERKWEIWAKDVPFIVTCAIDGRANLRALYWIIWEWEWECAIEYGTDVRSL